jgi:hypothetical protein
MARLQFDIIPSHKIDAAKWDNCVIKSNANRIYAKHIYLQYMADNWSGLVMNDYAAVMPIIWRKKWGIRYAYDAPFVQQLGLFGTYNTVDLKQAIDTVMQFIRYGDLYFNHTNAIQQFLPDARVATNLIIPLNTGYESISKGYKHGLRYELKKATANALQYIAAPNIELAVKMYQQLYALRLPSVTTYNYQKLIAVAKQLHNQKQCFVRQVSDKDNSLLAIALLLKDENRIYNVISAATEMGRKLSAMHFLKDNIFKEFADTPLIFDFEGSDVPGIKTFYQSFGAVNEPYFHVHYNHLPLLFRWLKR